ncbi:MAG TPA: methionine synthase [Phycisphaerales bacterium]|nr:methionine synthase [Phycisphaerales bacterium]
MPANIAAHLERRVLILDGAMGTSIHDQNLDLERDYCGCENCTDIISLTRPDVLQSIHESFLAVGADAVETNSFGGARHVLADNGLSEKTFELNKAAAEIARAACDAHSTDDKPRFVLGSMGPGTKLITLDQIHWDDLHSSYFEQARGLIAGGADALMIETCQDLLQVKCAINASLAAMESTDRSPETTPIFVSVTIEQTGTMLMGTAIEGVLAALAEYPILSLGLNCATGPAEMAEHVAYLGRHWRSKGRHLSVVPNAGLPVLVDGRTEYPLAPEPFTDSIERFVDRFGVGIVGGCCGTTPEHIRLLAERFEGRSPGLCEHRPMAPAATSLYGPTEYRQDSSILMIGERCNASGSRKFKRLLESEDWDGILALAREQVRDGSHVLDINVDYAGRDNGADMAEIVKRLVRQVDAPLMLDSTQVRTIEAGLKHAAGKCIINSANFEDGIEKFDQLCGLARTFNAGLVIGTIDEDPDSPMARTAERKADIARRAIERATSVHHLPMHDLFIDPLVLPISTGMETDRRSALELIEGIRTIADEFPDVQITCGLSNVSFGLKPAARVILNSVFLHELVDAGLTSAIVHSSKILPLNKIEDEHREAALDLIYDRRDTVEDPLATFVDLFSEIDQIGGAAKVRTNLTLEERLRAHIIDGEKEGLNDCIDEALLRYRPLEIINDHLLDGMKTVGELFASGEMQLPFVLQSAEVMKLAVSQLEPLMERTEGESRGTIVLATVKGDVHDIGKNLVDIILSNNGYTVHNLGIKQPIADILKAFESVNADAIGLSGLLVKSVNVMEDNLRELNARGISAPVLLGGAALTRHYAEGYLRSVYNGSLYYGKDAFEGLRIMDCLGSDTLSEIDEEVEQRQAKRSSAETKVALNRARQAEAQDDFARSKQPGVMTAQRSRVDTEADIPRPPFWGTRVIDHIDLDQVYQFINPIALFRTQWQFKKGKLTNEEYEQKLADEILPVYERLKAQCKVEHILQPAAVYGYFPANSSGNDLIVYDPEDHDREIERFVFPRQSKGKFLCISDFFRDVDSGVRDVLPMSCVTMGRKVSEVTASLFQSDQYTEYLYLHGLGVEAAEGLAELWHKRIRQELGIAGDDSPTVKGLFTQRYRGSRYSFGYPACPDMGDQKILFRLTQPERIGCTLTENWQIDPEQSTSAIIVHHPEAKYFNV